MISPSNPDYLNTPASKRRPQRTYAPRKEGVPLVSVVTPYWNTGSVFMETAESIKRMSYPHWEWIIVDDGSSDPGSLARLEAVQQSDLRVHVIRQQNSGPSVARNRAARQACGKYLLQLDSDDMVEPTFVEKSLWVMECQPQFAACSAYNVTFGARPLLWNHGFQEYERNLTGENFVTSQAMVRRDAYLAAGGYDESIVRGHEDWDFWLNLASAGYWGYTIPEHLTWYRTAHVSRRVETEADGRRSADFHKWLLKKHASLRQRFPHPEFVSGVNKPHPIIHRSSPFLNALEKPDGVRRVLFMVPWLTVGGADKFNLDLVRTLSQRGYEFTIVATRVSDNPWLHEFAQITPDIFILSRFLQYADYPRFLNYLIESRQIDAVLMSNSEFGYALAPFLRACHPNLPILDYCHVEEEEWNNGGYPWMSVRMESQLDLSVTSTEHLKRWMIGRGATPDHIQVTHTNIDPEEWDPTQVDPVETRRRLGIPPHKTIILYVGRVVDQKRPLLWAEIVRRLAQTEPDIIGVVVGEGDLLESMKAFVRRHRLQNTIKFLGALPNETVRELMATADILLLPSKYEGLALVLFEALAMKTVPVATNFGGHPELVTPACGYLIGPGQNEMDEYVAACQRLLSDPEKRRAMANAGFERVRQLFTLEKMADGIQAAFARAHVVAAVRPASGIDLTLANSIASSAIEHTRLNELSDKLWWELHHARQLPKIRTLGDAARLTRELLLPIGTSRYNVYKRIRRTLFPHGQYTDTYTLTNPDAQAEGVAAAGQLLAPPSGVDEVAGVDLSEVRVVAATTLPSSPSALVGKQLTDEAVPE